MARPEKKRYVKQPPHYNNFKPAGIQNKLLDQVTLSLDEYEALRLADYDNLEHSEAAEQMEISRPTFTRLITKAREKIAQFIVEGRRLEIDGGSVHFRENLFICSHCGNDFQGMFDDEQIVCPSCGSDSIKNLAKSFGHGRCCGKFRRQQQLNNR